MPDFSAVGALLHEAAHLLIAPRTWFVELVVLVAGVARGFSGFGGALIFIPLTAAMLGPKKAVAVFYLFDLLSATPFGYTHFNKCNLREVLPMIVAAALFIPAGAWVLATLDPLVLRWVMGVLVLAMLGLLMSGWRYKGQPTPATSLGVGSVAGFAAGSTGVSGPFVIAYWLSSSSPARVVRSNIMVFYALTSTVTDITFFLKGFFTFDVAVYALVAWPLYAGGLAIGARFFKGSSEGGYRSVAYVLIATTAIISLPLFDKWIR